MRRWIRVTIAVVAGLGAAAGAWWSAWSTVPRASEVEAVVVARSVAESEAVAPDALAVKRVPVAMLPPGAVRDPRQAAGKVAARPLLSGQYLTEADLSQGSQRRGLEPGQVGVAVKLPEGIGPALRPGDRVNVVAVPRGGEGQAGAVVLLAGKRIVALYDGAGMEVRPAEGLAAAVGKAAGAMSVQPQAGVPAYALLALTPDESAALRFAERGATIFIDLAPWADS